MVLGGFFLYIGWVRNVPNFEAQLLLKYVTEQPEIWILNCRNTFLLMYTITYLNVFFGLSYITLHCKYIIANFTFVVHLKVACLFSHAVLIAHPLRHVPGLVTSAGPLTLSEPYPDSQVFAETKNVVFETFNMGSNWGPIYQGQICSGR